MSKSDEQTLTLPLEGLKVLDFAQFLAGPAAALRLADLGAEVIKVERPKGGDLCRSLVINDQMFEGESLLFQTFNRNKYSVAADLKSSIDLEKIKILIADADVMIHNFRPGVMERIGLDYETVCQINPRMIYGVVTGYGSEGPWRGKPGQDLLAQSMSGICYLSGNGDDDPVPIGFALLDVATGANLVQGILAGIIRRGITGKGGLIEVELLTSAMDLQFEQLTAYFNDSNGLPTRSRNSNANVYGAAPYGIYKTKDGYLSLAMMPIKLLEDLLECPALEAFPQSDAFVKRDEIKAIIQTRLLDKTTDDWLAIMEPADVWCAKVMNWEELSKTEGFKAIDPLQQIKTASGATALTTRCPIRIDGQLIKNDIGAPVLGADTDRYLGVSNENAAS